MNYYNDNDRKKCAWLRELIHAGQIPNGIVDERNINEIDPTELAQYAQCHFFAGIGGWSYALKLAGWPEDKAVWTGSCPCQPFSQAGKRQVDKDERHVWPAFRTLIAQCRPSVCFGEQVAGKDGRIWLAGLRADLETLGYAVGSADLCAAGVSAPHIRQRLYWVAHAGHWQSRGKNEQRSNGQSQAERIKEAVSIGRCSETERLVQSNGAGRKTGQLARVDRLGSPNLSRSQGLSERIFKCPYQWPIGTSNMVVQCADGKARRFESGSFPLADGVPERVGLLRCYGDAIVPQVAAEFIQAFVEASDFLSTCQPLKVCKR